MGLRTLPARLATVDTRKVPTLQTKAGATEMERGRAWMEKRLRVARAHGYRCAGCGKVWIASRDHIDHIVPREQGGSNDESNLQPLCNEPCHAQKTASEAAQRAGRGGAKV